MKNRKRLLIFDFDGTIADTKAIYYKVISQKLKKFGYSHKDVDKAIDLGFSLKKTLNKMGFSFLVSWFLHKKINREVIDEARKVKKCKDVDSIKKIDEEKILVTNSLREFALPILKNFKLLKCFKEIYGAEDFVDKTSFIKKYAKANNLKKEDCYYIGDRAADAKTARKAGCRGVIILGRCAWDSKKEILKEKPDFMIASIKELKRILG